MSVRKRVSHFSQSRPPRRDPLGLIAVRLTSPTSAPADKTSVGLKTAAEERVPARGARTGACAQWPTASSVIPALRRGYLAALGTTARSRLCDCNGRGSSGRGVGEALGEIPAAERGYDERLVQLQSRMNWRIASSVAGNFSGERASTSRQRALGASLQIR